jgi:hypothetical protein
MAEFGRLRPTSVPRRLPAFMPLCAQSERILDVHPELAHRALVSCYPSGGVLPQSLPSHLPRIDCLTDNL